MEIKNIRNACSESLVVSLLRHGPRHGYEMGKEIEKRSGGYFAFKHSTLYPVLHKLEKKGLIKGAWQQSGNERPRKYYSLTPAGEKYGDEDASQWQEFFFAMQKLIPGLVLEGGTMTVSKDTEKQDPAARFKPMLSKLERELEIPYPQKRELVDELAAHMADIFDELVEEGFSGEEAVRRTVAAMALDREFIDSIDEVHRPLVARALAKLPPRVALGVEYGGIGLVAAVVMATIFLQEETMLEILLEGGIFMIPIGLMALAVLVLSVERIYSLFVKKDHSYENIERRLLSLKFLGSACALTGVVGTLMGLFQAFSASEQITAKLGAFPTFEVVRIAITTSIVGMVVALLALCAFYLFKAKASRIRGMQLS